MDLTSNCMGYLKSSQIEYWFYTTETVLLLHICLRNTCTCTSKLDNLLVIINVTGYRLILQSTYMYSVHVHTRNSLSFKFLLSRNLTDIYVYVPLQANAVINQAELQFNSSFMQPPCSGIHVQSHARKHLL